MANPTNREELKQFCLRKLGKPVIEINVADEQLEDRIDDALKMYHDFHYDGVERVIIQHQLTQTNIDNGYIEMSDSVISIERILDLNTGSSTEILFDAEYHMNWDAIYSSSSTPASLQHYVATKENVNLINELLNGKKPLRYRRHTDKLHIDMNWGDVTVGNYIVIQAYQIVDPTVYEDVWGDRWLLRYSTALFKRQWGENLSKFQGIQLPGGIQFDGVRILGEAREEINKLEDEMITSYSLPVHDMIG